MREFLKKWDLLAIYQIALVILDVCFINLCSVAAIACPLRTVSSSGGILGVGSKYDDSQYDRDNRDFYRMQALSKSLEICKCERAPLYWRGMYRFLSF